ncbi:MAG TPA: hypothetical protein VKU86_15020 [Acidimicrobiales bacterium]|nr:hypothetical protein [Acidimicrobiales bacterium]
MVTIVGVVTGVVGVVMGLDGAVGAEAVEVGAVVGFVPPEAGRVAGAFGAGAVVVPPWLVDGALKRPGASVTGGLVGGVAELWPPDPEGLGLVDGGVVPRVWAWVALVLWMCVVPARPDPAHGVVAPSTAARIATTPATAIPTKSRWRRRLAEYLP